MTCSRLPLPRQLDSMLPCKLKPLLICTNCLGFALLLETSSSRLGPSSLYDGTRVRMTA